MKKLRITLITTIAIIVLITLLTSVKRISPLSWSLHNKINQPLWSNEGVNGIDVVAYFTAQKAIPGNTNISYELNNTMWYFSSEEHKKMFEANPDKYIPQFGGYCSYAVSKGFTANTNPYSYEIINGKLYLFSNDEIKNKWKSSYKENLFKGTTYWN